MEYKIFQVDTFCNQIFSGNPACVVPLKEWLPDNVMLNIAKENAVSETAFFINKDEKLLLRWFTPDIEIDLCGHATLATAFVLKSILDYSSDELIFESKGGEIKVKQKDNYYYLDFPSRKPIKTSLPSTIKSALNIQPKEVFKARDYMLIYDSEKQIRDITINRHVFDQINLGCGGVITTAIGKEADFVSRYFTPQATILEDPVTGSAHCTLIPYWSTRLSKEKLIALQLSVRGGKLLCENNFDRVIIGGQAKMFMQGTIHI